MKETQQVLCGQMAGELLVRLQATLPDPAINTVTLRIEGNQTPVAVYRWEVLIESRRYLYEECVSFQKLADWSDVVSIAAEISKRWCDAARNQFRASR